jgi:hypothetical protein
LPAVFTQNGRTFLPTQARDRLGKQFNHGKIERKGAVVTQVGGNDLGPPGKRTGYLDLVVQVITTHIVYR